MKKVLIIGGGAVVGLITATVVAFYLSLGQIVGSTVEEHGSALLGTKVTVENVKIEPFDGYLSLQGLQIKNPRGFRADKVFRLTEIEIKLDMSTIRDELVIVEQLSLVEPQIFFELEVPQGSNLETLARNAQAYEARQEGHPIDQRGVAQPAESPPEASVEKPGRRIIVRNFQMLRAEINSGASATSSTIQKFPDFHIQDIGAEEGGITPGEVAQFILGQISKRMFGF